MANNDHRSGNGHVSQLQTALTHLIENYKTGVTVKPSEFLGANGKPDDNFGRNTRKALDELVILAQKHAGVPDSKITHELDDQNIARLTKYLESRGVKPDDKGQINLLTAITNMKNDVVNDVSLLDQAYTQYALSVKPEKVKLPAAVNTSMQKPAATKAPLSDQFRNNAETQSFSTTIYEYKKIIEAAHAGRDVSTFLPRVKAYEARFAEVLEQALQSKGVDTTGMDLKEITRKSLQSTVDPYHKDPKIQKIIAETAQEIMTTPLVVTLSKQDYKRENVAAFRGMYDTPTARTETPPTPATSPTTVATASR